jgi:peptidyl-prolyl cis-trans isomerase A (cyclophilin A)
VQRVQRADGRGQGPRCPREDRTIDGDDVHRLEQRKGGSPTPSGLGVRQHEPEPEPIDAAQALDFGERARQGRRQAAAPDRAFLAEHEPQDECAPAGSTCGVASAALRQGGNLQVQPFATELAVIFRHWKLVVLTLALSCWLAGCERKPEPGGSTSEAPSATKPTASASAKPQGPPLLNPQAATEKAPDKYRVKFETTKGDFVIEVIRDWAPRGADRVYNLVQIAFYKDIALHRVVEDFVVQFGIHGDPQVSAAWAKAYLLDEAVKESNKQWTVTFAKADADTRATQIFINLQDNLDLVKKLYSGYGEKVMGRGGNTEVFKLGNAYFKDKWPKLDYIKSATIVE